MREDAREVECGDEGVRVGAGVQKKGDAREVESEEVRESAGVGAKVKVSRQSMTCVSRKVTVCTGEQTLSFQLSTSNYDFRPNTNKACAPHRRSSTTGFDVQGLDTNKAC